MNAREVFNLTGPLKSRVASLVELGVVKLVQESKKLRELQLRIGGKTTPDDFSHFEPYGMTARPHDGAEALVVNIGGDRTTPLVLCVADRRYRIELDEGEVALYDDQGAFVKLSRTGIVVEPAAGQTVELGDGATAAVGRVGDEIGINAATDAAFITWVSTVSGFINGLVPGTIPIVPSSLTGTITAGSSVIKAVD